MTRFFKQNESLSPSGFIIIDETGRRGKILHEKRKIGICTWCGGATIKPRTLWCSKECVEKYKHTQPNDLKILIKKRDKRTCVICGVFCPTKNTYDMDHIIPISQGGHPFNLDNLRLLCIDCHKKETKKLYNKE